MPDAPDAPAEPPGSAAQSSRPAEPPAEPSRSDLAWAGLLMREQAGASWLVPLLAPPLAELIASPLLTDSDLTRVYREPAEVRAIWAALAPRILAAVGGEAPLDDRAALDLANAVTWDRGILALLVPARSVASDAMGLDPQLAGPGLVRRLAEVIPEVPVPLPEIALRVEQLLWPLVESGTRVDFLPRAHTRFAAVTRALDARCRAEGLAGWEDALRLAHGYWSGDGWRDLLLRDAGPAQLYMDDVDAELAANAKGKPAEAPDHSARLHLEARLRDTERSRDALAREAKELAGLREEVGRLRTQEGKLREARDRAQARVKELEARVAELERETRSQRHELDALRPSVAEPPGPAVPSSRPVQPSPSAVPVQPPEPPLPADLLTGRRVFLFTGQLRAAVAAEMGRELERIGAEDPQVHCVHKGTLGPETFPDNSVVVMDLRFLGHKHSERVEARARRSGANYLPVKSGKGGLARAVAEAWVRRGAS
ncbi:MAG TPA: hypothetical protein VJ773_03030 [Gemmatimonadales bacterium]|nr:hypothetical protein [Gemmatimonadales bacterium]